MYMYSHVLSSRRPMVNPMQVPPHPLFPSASQVDTHTLTCTLYIYFIVVVVFLCLQIAHTSDPLTLFVCLLCCAFPSLHQPPTNDGMTSFSAAPPGGNPPGPAFPAGAPSSSSSFQQSSSAVVSLPQAPSKPVSKVLPVGAGCKLMHPEDDLSLVRTIYMCATCSCTFTCIILHTVSIAPS